MNTESSRLNGDLLEKIENLKDKKNSLLEEIREYVQNTNYPLEDRWEVFYDAGNSGIIPELIWTPDWNRNTGAFLEDYLSEENRYSIIKIPDLLNDIEYKKEKFGENIEEELQEAIIKDFMFSFKYDW